MVSTASLNTLAKLGRNQFFVVRELVDQAFAHSGKAIAPPMSIAILFKALRLSISLSFSSKKMGLFLVFGDISYLYYSLKNSIEYSDRVSFNETTNTFLSKIFAKKY
jgi:hypothetical protein